MAPRVRQLIAEHARGAQVVVLRSRRAVRRYLTGLAAPGSAAASAVAVEGTQLTPSSIPRRSSTLYASADQIARRTREP
jgi:hypothetical protein